MLLCTIPKFSNVRGILPWTFFSFSRRFSSMKTDVNLGNETTYLNFRAEFWFIQVRLRIQDNQAEESISLFYHILPFFTIFCGWDLAEWLERLAANVVTVLHGIDPSILRHSKIIGAADEAVLNNVHKTKKSKKNLPFKKTKKMFCFFSCG